MYAQTFKCLDAAQAQAASIEIRTQLQRPTIWKISKSDGGEE